ncbi:hypothetical protein EJ070_06310 [Mesorhizobium sp. M1E.F.Ca.ET.045.02.1.1]|uniref:hypothetical protein n=1 Tax=unclassified Mesorhizobium TaxID=325217 RepID=UPI000F7632AE|nr:MULTISPECIES: hypothetical protein [unclassified Mesorhizobium]AZO20317.1 hypothetical protein EJ070_06310 [Mesorhizobium sp. M1E.F.Ca.ET.045.02.1.1]RUW82815.1 hypothetical protein EOA29_16055 [Mesorhizobium sp. M1E.F.Ca.ET.063.01.1.1]
MPDVVSPQKPPAAVVIPQLRRKASPKIWTAIQRVPRQPRLCNLRVQFAGFPITFEDGADCGGAARQALFSAAFFLTVVSQVFEPLKLSQLFHILT